MESLKVSLNGSLNVRPIMKYLNESGITSLKFYNLVDHYFFYNSI